MVAFRIRTNKSRDKHRSIERARFKRKAKIKFTGKIQENKT